MRKLIVTKEYKWDMSHMLSDHKGLCAGVHGHTYTMEVSVSKVGGGTISEGPSEGMVIDFKDLKNVVNTHIVDPLDHAFMGWEKGNVKEQKVIETLVDCEMKVELVPYRTTAENMCINVFDTLKDLLYPLGINLERVSIWEGPKSFATVTA